MSIKDELHLVKEELSSDEKILESAFKLERVYKKYKFLIWGVVIGLVLFFGGRAAWGSYQQSKRLAANDALLTLMKDPGNSAALEKLKTNNPALFDLYTLSTAMEKGSVDTLKELESNGDAMIADLARYHAAVWKEKAADSTYYHDMSVVEEAYLALKAGDKATARSKLALLDENSPVAKIAQLLRHYTLEGN